MTTTIYPIHCNCVLRYENQTWSIIKPCDDHKGWTIKAILDDLRQREENAPKDLEGDNGEKI